MRFFRVSVRLVLSTIPPIVIDNTVAEDVTIEWSVSKRRGPTPDTADVTIYNLGLPARKALSAYVGNPIPLLVALFVGWEGIPEHLFAGVAMRIEPGREAGSDIVTVIEVGDGVQEYRDTPPSTDAFVGDVFSHIVEVVAAELGLFLSRDAIALIQGKVSSTPLHVLQSEIQIVHMYNPKEELDAVLGSIGLSWGREGSRLVVYENGLRNDVLPAILRPDTGLISWTEVDKGGVEFEAMTQARCVPGMQVQMQRLDGSPIGAGTLRLEAISFAGTSNGPSVMRGSARRIQTI